MGDGELLGIHHVQLAMPAGGEERAVEFYERVLALRRVEKPSNLRGRGGCWFSGDGVELHLGVEEDFRPARKAHPALLVRGLEGLRTRLQGAGVRIVDGEPLEGHSRCYAFDPFGNRIELMESI